MQELASQNVILLVGRGLQRESPFGIVILRVDNEDAARQIMENDPAVQKGMMRATLSPFQVLIMPGA